ncbi:MULTISPECIES: sigma-70 family RNA polymerase sigma factor [Paenibacillus]|uniref:Sigma-70 family RNA polymerase sigma factor n=1 Tax=Paenibacillus alvei TaxID=44250 RepID=A0ABT4ECP3_PAEAL|nr:MULTISPECIES: sigma-70 family RNA polymerase sigma factor [Paenibacillus]EPY13582.1 ECF subfamily RNA polymerase sigma-24 factor [Paenibacillus alvei A6-6i-x]MCY9531496.1 sigma-70 family RNA polymerase sigma factor [Paenibacillus alvei]SDG40135.1 RNA polymerase sigma-70 factor, ECF subfamily [Paenibacillus sp. cl6col]
MDEDKQGIDIHRFITEARNGNFDAFRQIVLQYSNAMLSVAFSIIGDFHEAQDATQEAFTKCYRRLHTLDDPSKLGSWLYAIVYRTSLDFVKKKKQTLPYEGVIAPSNNNIDTWLNQHMTQETIWNAMQHLEQTSKMAIMLHYLSEWTMKEISQFLNISLSAVESRIRRARATLRRQLTGEFESYFRMQRLDRKFEQKVSERILRSAGHFYIPVLHRERVLNWFVQHFQLGISRHGNLLVESGHELYLLECHTHLPSDLPLLAFEVSDIEELWHKLQHDEVKLQSINTNPFIGKYFIFYDPDGNSYHAVEHKEKRKA